MAPRLALQAPKSTLLEDGPKGVLWLAICGVRSVGQQSVISGVHPNTLVVHRVRLYETLRVPNMDEAVNVAVRQGDVYIRELHEPTTVAQDVCRFVGDVWRFSRNKRPQDCASFTDVLMRFKGITAEDVMETLKQLDEGDWIERMMVDGVERYKPLATP